MSHNLSGHARQRFQSLGRPMLGQVWTPDWLAAVMVEYVLFRPGLTLFDPAVGAGAFFHAGWRRAQEQGHPVFLRGMEIDPTVLPRMVGDTAPVVVTHGELTSFERHLASDMAPAIPFHSAAHAPTCALPVPDAKVIIGDFLSSPPLMDLEAVTANPPYIRHHRIKPEQKNILRGMVRQRTGLRLDGRAGLHVYFLIHALTRTVPGGRLAFLLPADVCEGRFAPALWNWIVRQAVCDAVLTFTPEASPFPGVDINPLVLFLRRDVAASEIGYSSPPVPARLSWGICRAPDEVELGKWIQTGFSSGAGNAMTAFDRDLDEGLATGLSRFPVRGRCLSAAQFSLSAPASGRKAGPGLTLGDVAQVMRGIVTGANDFFLLTDRQVAELGLSDIWLRPCVGRVRDVPEDDLTVTVLDRIRTSGRPVWLLWLTDVHGGWEQSPDCPEQLRQYLAAGKDQGLPLRPLLCRRRPWFRMESRAIPPFLFAYLGRRRLRFIRNSAGVVPLNGFLCLYPRSGVDSEWLWQVLTAPEVLDGLYLVGKSYGGGALKVEPRSLERLSIPADVLHRFPCSPVIPNTLPFSETITMDSNCRSGQ